MHKSYCYVFTLLFGIVHQVQGADEQHQIKPLFGLLKEVHDITHLPKRLCKKVGEYVGMCQLWQTELQSNERAFVRSLSAEELVVIEQGQRMTIVGKDNGEYLRSPEFKFAHRSSPIRYAEVTSGNRVIVAYGDGRLECVHCDEKERRKNFGCETHLTHISGLAVTAVDGEPKVAVIGQTREGDAGYAVHDVNEGLHCYKPCTFNGRCSFDYLASLPDGNVRFRYHEEPLLHFPKHIYHMLTLGVRDGSTQSDNISSRAGNERYVLGNNVVEYRNGELRLYRAGKDIGTVPCGNLENLLAEIPGGFVTGFGKQLLVKDNDGDVVDTLLEGEEIQEVRYFQEDNLLVGTLASASGGKAKVVAWQHMASPEEFKVEEVITK